MAATQGGRVTFKVGTQVFSRWTHMTIVRDMHEIAASFELRLLDPGRLPDATVPPISCGQACSIALDGETVLVGRVEVTEIRETGTTLDMTICGRDATGLLTSGAANPTGPAEYKGLTLTQIASAICAPYGVTARAEVDVGAPFTRFSIHPHQTALAAIENAARQRSTLVTSDGVGGLVLTRGGNTRAPWHLVRGENLHELHRREDWRRRFSDVFVKGQSDRGAGARAGGAASASLSDEPVATPGAPGGTASAGILMTGHATDPEIPYWHPHVRLTRSQAGMSSTQAQAEWQVRVFRGEAQTPQYTVLDWRAGPPVGSGAPALWRPNAEVAVYDPPAGLDKDMLIAGVTYRMDERGVATVLRLVGLGAYDLVNEAERRRGHTGAPRHRRGARD